MLSDFASHGLQHTRLLSSPLSPRVCSSSCPLSQWCNLTISSSTALFSFAFNLSQHQDLFQSDIAAAKSLQSCLTLCDPIDGSLPSFPVLGILQARTLEWVAISFSNAWKWKVKVRSLSRVQLLATPWTAAHQAPPSMDSPGKSTGVGCHRGCDK